MKVCVCLQHLAQVEERGIKSLMRDHPSFKTVIFHFVSCLKRGVPLYVPLPQLVNIDAKGEGDNPPPLPQPVNIDAKGEGDNPPLLPQPVNIDAKGEGDNPLPVPQSGNIDAKEGENALTPQPMNIDANNSVMPNQSGNIDANSVGTQTTQPVNIDAKSMGTQPMQTSEDHMGRLPIPVANNMDPHPRLATLKKDCDSDDNDDYLDPYIKTLSAASSLPNPQNNPNPLLANNNHNPSKLENNNLLCCKPGIQVSVYDFQKLPTPGNIYRVDDKHQLVALRFIPGEVYQADEHATLIPIGLFNYHFNANSNNLPE